MEIIGLLAPWCIEKWVRLFGVTSMWLLSNLQTTQIIILICPSPSFPIKMLLDPQMCSHQPITPKFGPDIGGFTNLEEALLSLGGRPKNFVQIKKWRPHHFYPSKSFLPFLCCVVCTFYLVRQNLLLMYKWRIRQAFTWCTNVFFFFFFYGFCACLLALAHSFIYIQNTCNKCASPTHVNQPRLWWTEPSTINIPEYSRSPCWNSVKKLARVNRHPLAHQYTMNSVCVWIGSTFYVMVTMVG